jgi:hypothetical protein
MHSMAHEAAGAMRRCLDYCCCFQSSTSQLSPHAAGTNSTACNTRTVTSRKPNNQGNSVPYTQQHPQMYRCVHASQYGTNSTGVLPSPVQSGRHLCQKHPFCREHHRCQDASTTQGHRCQVEATPRGTGVRSHQHPGTEVIQSTLSTDQFK